MAKRLKVKVIEETSQGVDIINLDDLKKNNVAMSNVLIRSAQKLSLIEKRILMACVSKMRGREVELKATEYAQTYDIELNKSYQHLKEGVTNLFNRYLTFNFKDGEHIGVMHVVWLQSAGYVDGEGKVIIEFSDKLMPQLVNLKGQFTQYQLQQAASLRSIHSWRLLELLEQMRQKQPEGYLTINIEDFWHAMEVKESYRSNFSLLRQYVIDPAVKELNEKDGWAISYYPFKKGRKVAILRFEFEKDPQQRLMLDFDTVKSDFEKQQARERKNRQLQGLPNFDKNNWSPA